MKMLNEDFQVHDTLNPLIWDSNNKLLVDVKKHILATISLFEDYVNIPMNIIDVQIVGSNASYNYNESSDLDVHIITNFEDVNEDVNLVRLLYDAYKSNFNKNFDITIHGIEIEMYVQDVNSGIASNGIYSVYDNKWIKFPKPIDVVNFDTTREVAKWKNVIEDVLIRGKSEEIKNLINRLYLIRHNSIAVNGEHSKGNQIFKDIRSLGLLDKLKEESNKALSKEMSLESLTKGQIVNRFN